MLPRDHRRAAGEARPELADIFRRYGESYRKTHFLLAPQRKVMRAVEVCRTKVTDFTERTHPISTKGPT